MSKVVRYTLIIIGIIVALYGVLKDFDVLTFSGTFVFVFAIILPLLKALFKK